MRRGRIIYTCVRFFDEKDFRIGYTCISSLIAPLKDSSFLAVRELRCPGFKMADLDRFPGHRMEDRGARKQGGILRSTHGEHAFALTNRHPSAGIEI